MEGIEKEVKPAEFVVKNCISSRLMEYAAKKRMSLVATRSALANHLNITTNKLAYWERNHYQPSLEQAFLIAAYFGLKITAVFETEKTEK